MSILMSSRRTIMSGEVVTFATEFTASGSRGGTNYHAGGPFEISASREGVAVHQAFCRSSEERAALLKAISLATDAAERMAKCRMGGAASIYPTEPTACDDWTPRAVSA